MTESTTHEGLRRGPGFRVVGAGLLAIAIVASSAILGRAAVDVFRIHHAEKRITVTGSATRRIVSDLVIWRAGVKSQAPEMAQAYKKLETDVPVLVGFLEAHGIAKKDIKVAAATIREIHGRDRDGHEMPETISAYVTEQSVEVTSTEIDKVEATSRAVTDLIDRGVYIESESPLYVYTKLADLKIQMLSEAAKDARLRADQIAQSSGAKIVSLIQGRMGVMQVNPAHSTEVSAEGNNDKSSLEKDVLAIVTSSFAID